jgi:hypothetical protein
VRSLGTIEGQYVIEWDDGSLSFHAKAAIDSDGIGLSHGDPDWQGDTALHFNGRALNADKDRYIVVPPLIIESVNGVVLGCKAVVTNLLTGRSTPAVVGDIGPHSKLGEISIACAASIGVDQSPVVGGEDRPVIFYQLWPGQPAVVFGVEYTLQPTFNPTQAA